MEALIIGLALIALSLITDLDDVFFGLPLLPAVGAGTITYGALTFTTLSSTAIWGASVAAALLICYVYKRATSIKSKNLNDK